MKRIKEENGYALIIVLFAIVFITTISAVFMRGSISNLKQDQRVDESNLTTTVAEAGLDYYVWEIEKEYENKKVLLTNIIEEEIKKKDGDPQMEVAKKLKEILESKISTFTGQNIKFTDEYNHTINPSQINVKINNNVQPVTVVVEGTVDGNYIGEFNNNKSIDFDLRFDIPNYNSTDDDSSDGTVGELDISLPTWINNKPGSKCSFKSDVSEIKGNKNALDCFINSTEDMKKLKKTEGFYLYIDGQFIAEKKLEIEDQSDLYVKKNLKVNKDFELEKGSRLFVGGNVEVSGKGDDDEFEIQEDSHAYILGNVKVGDDIEVQKNSTLYVKGYVEAGDDVEVEENSSMHVDGYMIATDEIEVEEKSRLHVTGDVTAGNDIEVEKSSSMYVGGNLVAGKDLEVEKKSTLHVNGNAKITKDLEVKDSSSMYVGEDLTVSKDLEVEKKSNLFVGSLLTATKKLEVKSKSNVCANDFKIKGAEIKLDSDSFIYYWNSIDIDLSSKKIKNIENIQQVSSFAELNSKCGSVYEPSEDGPVLDDPIIENVIY